MQLDDLYTFQITKYMFQYSCNLLPIPLMNLFTPNTNIHAHNTRQRFEPHIKTFNSHKFAQCILHKGPKYTNNSVTGMGRGG